MHAENEKSSTLFMLPRLDEWLDATHFDAAWNENIYDAAAAAVNDSRYNGRLFSVARC